MVSDETYRQCLAAVKFLYTVTFGRTWEVERLPYPRHRQKTDETGHDRPSVWSPLHP